MNRSVLFPNFGLKGSYTIYKGRAKLVALSDSTRPLQASSSRPLALPQPSSRLIPPAPSSRLIPPGKIPYQSVLRTH